jgi:hypothetical protein
MDRPLALGIEPRKLFVDSRRQGVERIAAAVPPPRELYRAAVIAIGF